MFSYPITAAYPRFLFPMIRLSTLHHDACFPVSALSSIAPSNASSHWVLCSPRLGIAVHGRLLYSIHICGVKSSGHVHHLSQHLRHGGSSALDRPAIRPRGKGVSASE